MEANILAEIKRQVDINKRLPEILLANWSKIKPLFVGYRDVRSILGEIQKEVIFQIIRKVIDLEAFSAKE